MGMRKGIFESELFYRKRMVRKVNGLVQPGSAQRNYIQGTHYTSKIPEAVCLYAQSNVIFSHWRDLLEDKI